MAEPLFMANALRVTRGAAQFTRDIGTTGIEKHPVTNTRERGQALPANVIGYNCHVIV
ncbi:hypothetical protein FOMPIDRAFT_94019 [Fomitopsis schrenkii]|uniref:Uncharacterized protein n=1 Tax=Fomitopsis schrenkii TaxID=2126942 RepID=S8DNF5_FOMSC|nr:hypothetical protein FOMPIDRAFT_94019 [Fomitopsis schrenkii]